MIDVENVTKYFDQKKVISNISFTVKEGETVVLLGTSGCGKTTSLRMINRLTEPSSGKIILDGAPVTSLPPEKLRRRIGYVLQHNGLFPHYTIAENIAIVPHLLKWPNEKISERTRELMSQLHLSEEYLTMYPQQLSGGQQQRAGLARALAADPPLLLMDEPFGALDAITRQKITREFSTLDVLKKKTILMVTHDIREALQLGDRIILMDRGEIIQQGTPTDLLFHPATDFVKNFFDSQRMQYELESLSLAGIWNYLPHQKKEGSVDSLNDRITLWQALHELNNHDSGKFFSQNPETGEEKLVDHASIFSALSQFKLKA